MKTRILPLAVLASCVAVHAADIEITSLASNGRLTWTNSFTNGLFSIEWAPALGTNTWRSNWTALQAFWVSGRTSTVEVPMFYRVKAQTNLFIPLPLGGQFIYSSSNAVTGVSTLRWTIAGILRIPALAKDFTIIENLSTSTLRLMPVRSTDTELWAVFQSGEENIMWWNGPVGSVRTNYFQDGRTQTLTVETNEVVTVPAGTFSCVRMRKRDSNPTEPEVVGWFKPGFGGVKWVEYWTDRSPDYYDLQSWSSPAQ